MSQMTWLLVKGTPTWVYKRALILNCISSYLFIFYTLFLHGLLCYIPSILDNSCVSELCSSHLTFELVQELLVFLFLDPFNLIRIFLLCKRCIFWRMFMRSRPGFVTCLVIFDGITGLLHISCSYRYTLDMTNSSIFQWSIWSLEKFVKSLFDRWYLDDFS